MRQYRSLHFVSSVDADVLPPRVRSEPATDPARLAYERKIGLVLREDGFWDGAEVFYAEAKRFQALRFRQQPVKSDDVDTRR